ncbi:hypothetical protein TALC_00656 [Thermoplasmatales archaeon BRNA1]|nr:hypothetical protein TALC_00656 [Thermoplasmatales archaeon BRNA1]
MDRHPGRWAALSGSDAHSLYTAGYNWTEFPGTTAEEFRQAILHRKTVPVGVPAPEIMQVYWSMEVVKGGQELMRKALRGELQPVEGSRLVTKVLTNTSIKNATGLYGGYAYRFPLVSMLATILSVTFLKRKARKAMRHIDRRLADIDKMIEEFDDHGRD